MDFTLGPRGTDSGTINPVRAERLHLIERLRPPKKFPITFTELPSLSFSVFRVDKT